MKKYRYLFIFSLLLFFFRLLLPVKIIGVHKLGVTSTIVIVKNFPLTRMGKYPGGSSINLSYTENGRLSAQ
jgi:hypothetical protein